MSLVSTRRGIVYPAASGADSADVPLYIGNLIPALDADVFYIQGTLAARPAASMAGRIYEATDQTPHQKFWDTGTAWDPLGAPVPAFGLRANRPAAAANPGGFYYATDQASCWLSDGTNWYRVGPADAGTIIWTAESAARTGYLIPSGQAWPGTTGPYADLFALWGGQYPTVLPDMPGRVFVAKGTHADVSTNGFTDGLPAASRRPKHKHTKNGTVSRTGSVTKTGTVSKFGTVTGSIAGLTQIAGYNGAGGQTHLGTTGASLLAYSPSNAVTISDSIGVTDGIGVSDAIAISDPVTIGPQTGAEPTDTVAYIVLTPQVKL